MGFGITAKIRKLKLIKGRKDERYKNVKKSTLKLKTTVDLISSDRKLEDRLFMTDLVIFNLNQPR